MCTALAGQYVGRVMGDDFSPGAAIRQNGDHIAHGS
jgi:hypothetical protein